MTKIESASQLRELADSIGEMATFQMRIERAFAEETKRRKEAGEPKLTKTHLWKAAGVSSSAASHWFNGENGADLDACIKIAPLLRVNPYWLYDESKPIHDGALLSLYGGGVSSVSESYDVAPTELGDTALIRGYVPLISWVQAGDWQAVIDNLSPGEGELVETTYNAKRHTYALRVKGDSMEPRFPDGSILIVEPDEPAVHGKFVIVRQNGNTEATFKQLVQDGSNYYLKPLNPRYPIMELRPDAVICGVVKRVEMDV